MSRITVFTARRVRTMDAGRPIAEAVAVMDGKVLSTGTLQSMQPWLARNEYVIDETFKDKVILPGFIDPHTHFYVSSAYLALHYVGPVDPSGGAALEAGLLTHAAVLDKLREMHRIEQDRSRPLVAWGLDPASQGGALTKDELDAVFGDRPVWVISYAPHFVYVTSAALGRIGIDDSCTVHGVLRYPDGRLNGVFAETLAVRLALKSMQREVLQGAGVNGMQRMGRLAQRAGVTSTAEMVFGSRDIEQELEANVTAVNALDYPVRMAVVAREAVFHERHQDKAADVIAAFAERNTDKLIFRGVKFHADGSYPAMSSRVNFPGYLDGGNGLRNDVPWDQLAERMLPYWMRGIPIHCHANGDEAVDVALDALEQLQQTLPRFDHRFTIEHYCISTTMQARRLKVLGGLASVNNYFVHYRSQLHSAHAYGPDRSEAVARLGTLEREGVTFALHSDAWLVMVPLHPLTAIWAAVNRIAADGVTVVAPGERIGVDRAVRAVTLDAAHVIGQENRVGSLEPGKHADFVVLEEDPYEVDPLRIRDIKVWGTVLSGRLQPV